jgi:hypothetical protein
MSTTTTSPPSGRQVEKERARGLALALTRFLEIAWGNPGHKRLEEAVEEVGQRLADVASLNEDGLTPQEAAAVPSGADELPDEDEPPEPAGL